SEASRRTGPFQGNSQRRSGIMTARHHGHPTEDDLILHFYAEGAQPAAIQRHLAACERCAAEYDTIAGTLKLVAAPPIPERGDLYGLEVWQRIRPLLPAREPWWRMSALRWKSLTLGAVVTALTISAFVAGRYWAPTAMPVASSSRTAGAQADADERARTVARSEEHTSELQSRGHLVCR